MLSIFSYVSGPSVSSFSKVILVLEKARSCRAPNLDCRVAESPGWFDVSQKNSAQDVMHEWACNCDEAANHQLSIARAFWTIQIVSMDQCSRLTENLMQIRCSPLCHFECYRHRTHMLTQWNVPPSLTSAVKSLLFMHVHSSPLYLAAMLH